MTGQGRANQALDALRGGRFETQLTAADIHGRPHAIQGTLVGHHLSGEPVDELVGILNTRLAETEGGANLDAVILDRAATPVVRDVGLGWDADLPGQMRHDGGRHFVLAGGKATFVAEKGEQRREPEASRARLIGQQGLIARLQRPLGRQFIVVPQALHHVLPVCKLPRRRSPSRRRSRSRHREHEVRCQSPGVENGAPASLTVRLEC